LTPSFRAGNPTVLFEKPTLVLDARLIANTGRTYDVARDGQRFLMVKDEEFAAAPQTGRPGIIVVQNWFQELQAAVQKAK
jgi:hypothetical protein